MRSKRILPLGSGKLCSDSSPITLGKALNRCAVSISAYGQWGLMPVLPTLPSYGKGKEIEATASIKVVDQCIHSFSDSFNRPVLGVYPLLVGPGATKSSLWWKKILNQNSLWLVGG